MGKFNKETAERSVAEYMKVFNWLLEICPNLETNCNDYNGRTLLPRDFEQGWGGPSDVLRHATGVNVGYSELFEYTRPRLISANSSIWREGFLTVGPYIRRDCPSFEWEGARLGFANGTDEKDGYVEEQPARARPVGGAVALRLREKRWALKDWFVKYDEIFSYMDSADDEVKAAYRKAIRKADAEVRSWQEAISAAPPQIPVPEVA